MDGSDIQRGESLRRHFRRPLPRLACGVRCWSVFGTDTLWSQLATAAAHLKTLITHSLSSHITSFMGIALDSLVLPVYPRPHGYIHRDFIHRMRARIRFEQYTLSHPPICSFEGTRLIPWPSPERSKSISDEPRLLKESAFGRLLALPKELPIACCAWGGDLTRA